MGTSTDAYLFFGVNLGDIDEVLDLLKLDEHPDDLCSYIEEKIKSVGLKDTIKVDIHCYHDAPTYFIYAKKFVANRGDAIRLEYKDFEVQNEWIANLVTVFETMGIGETAASWVLVSYWG